MPICQKPVKSFINVKREGCASSRTAGARQRQALLIRCTPQSPASAEPARPPQVGVPWAVLHFSATPSLPGCMSLPWAWPLRPRISCLTLFVTDLLVPHVSVQAASVFFRGGQFGDLVYSGKVVVFRVPTWNLPGLNLSGKASLAYAQTMPREDVLPPCLAVWVATLAQTKHFTSGNKSCS